MHKMLYLHADIRVKVVPATGTTIARRHRSPYSQQSLRSSTAPSRDYCKCPSLAAPVLLRLALPPREGEGTRSPSDGLRTRLVALLRARLSLRPRHTYRYSLSSRPQHGVRLRPGYSHRVASKNGNRPALALRVRLPPANYLMNSNSCCYYTVG